MSFNTLKKNKGNFSELADKLNKVANNETQYNDEDPRFWQPTVDKAGNGYAVIRFLPAPEGEDLPYVRYWDHGFEGPGGWYIEKSLSSIGQDDPVLESNGKLWDSGVEANKKIVSEKRKRRMHFVSNILVITDPGKPECEGKNYLYNYGKKIFGKCNDAMHPTMPDETAFNPFDFWSGANFKLKIRKVDGQRNYDTSMFDNSSELFKGDDDKLEELYNKLYSLKEFIDPKNYKTYDELKARLNKILGNTDTYKPSADDFKETPSPKMKEKKSDPIPQAEVEDDDDNMEFFERMAKE